jgi:thiol-disulfide isomerase/thioredoxin
MRFVPILIAVSLAVPLLHAQTAEETIATMKLTDVAGRTWTAADVRGRVTLIDFWASWCAPCLTELPYLKQARARYPRQELEIIGVSFDVSDRRSFVSWINRHAVTWPQVFDGRGRRGPVARHFGVSAVPTSLLIDAEGRIVARNLRGERLLVEIERQLTKSRAYWTSSFDAARVPIVTR